jgi:LysM repeat protein
LPRGYKIEYLVKFGDVLSLIAQQFNSTEDAILQANEDLADANEIFPCQVLIIPINLVTPIPAAATETPIPNVTPGAISTLTPSPTATP